MRFRTKEEAREFMWSRMQGNMAFIKPVYNTVPDFKGSSRACENLYDKLKNLQRIFVSPDAPLTHLRELLVQSGKTVVMPTPRLKEGFVLVDGKEVSSKNIRYSVTLSGALKTCKTVNHVEGIDAFVVGSVCVGRDGSRVGKGGGFEDLAYGILRESNSIKDSAEICTVVHEMQIVTSLPNTFFDIPIDIISTQRRVIVNERRKRPNRVYWELLNKRKIEEISALKTLKH